MHKVVILSGSPNASSRLIGMTNYIRQSLSDAGFQTAAVNVVDLPPEDLVYTRFNSPHIIAANELIEQADAVIIASPVYKASFTGVLKAYIDLLPQKGFEGKIITPVFIAGSMAHLLSIDYSLKPVLASMGARQYTKSIFATDSSITREQLESGEYVFTIDVDTQSRLSEVVQELTNYLQK
ncbi:MAG: NADPH-dependent FMN reductase [Candidatus Pristimantibacillus lignocellulolyticus]|uniref:NADPH-dependent FMN reductase n=1 Tax=Candidatus Pristimantibacillus lignocellulolyticus TaxID=2994561 RepID=A0A9J6ZH59_9BACL|nr:MAG: NADPH-dependent FMN reductase [Candidatus Pristimantibacillus lignocellulolyticus]